MRDSHFLVKWMSLVELVLVLAVAIMPRILSLGPTFVVNDETLYWSWSNDFAKALLSRDWAGTIVGDVYPSVTVMWVQVIGFGLRWLWSWLNDGLDAAFFYRLGLDRTLDFALLWQRRLPMALANAGLVVFIYFYVRRLWGRPVALVGLLLIALDPFLLADARTMRGDSLMAGFMTLSVLALLLARRQRRPGRAWGQGQLIVSAIMAGLALLTKMSALPIIIFGVAALVGVELRPAWTAGSKSSVRFRHLWGAGIWPAVIWLAVVSLTCWLLWPALWVAPDQVWGAMVNFAAGSADGRPTYFMGRHTETELLPLFYPVTFLFRSTPLTVLGLGLLLTTAVSFVYRQRQRRATLFTPRAVELGLLGLYSLIYMTLMTVGILKRSWYLLPIFPAAMILSAHGWVWLADQLRRRWLPLARPAIGLAALGTLLVVQVVQAIPVHPYYYTYWNPLARGPFEPTQLEMLSWGIDTTLTAQWLNAQPNPEQIKLAIRPSFRELRPLVNSEIIGFTAERPWVQANYIVLRERQLQLEEYDSYLLDYLQRLTPAHTMTLNGVNFGWVYPGPAAQVYANSKLAGKATLLGYSLPPEPLAGGQPAWLELYWHNRGLAEGEHIFVRLVDSDGFGWTETRISALPGFEAASETMDALVHSRADLSPPLGMPPGLYFLKMGIEESQNHQLIGEFALPAGADQLTVTTAGPTSRPLPELTHNTPQPLGPDLLLLGYNLPDTLPSTSAVVDLYWQARRDIQADYVLALRLLDETSREVWYQLARPARGIYPTPGWPAGEVVRDPWLVTSLDEVSPGSYTLELELYQGEDSIGRVTLGPVAVAASAESHQPAQAEATAER